MKRLTMMLLPVFGMTTMITHSVASGQDCTRERPQQELRSHEAAPELSAEDDLDLDEENVSEDVVDDDQDLSDDQSSEIEEEDFADDDIDTVRSAAASESMPVWRVQVRFQTADVSKAGTDDDVKVELNGVNLTWVNYGRNDFERADDFTYDLMLDNVTRLSDITKLKISKTGSDGWCLRKISLLVNGQLIFSRLFPANHWLDTSEGQSNSYTISGTTMRASGTWKNYQVLLQNVLKYSDVASFIEATVGHVTHGTDLRFSPSPHGSGYVEVYRNNGKIHVDLDLYYAPDEFYIPNIDIDVDFDVVLSCSSGQMSVDISDVRADLGVLDDLTFGLLNELVNAHLPDLIGPVFSQFSLNISLPACPHISIGQTGVIFF